MKKDYDSTRIYRNTQKKGASQTYDTPSFVLLVVEFAMSYTYCLILNIDFFQFFRDSTFIRQKSTRVIRKIVLTLQP